MSFTTQISLVEREINKGIINFALENNIPISDTDIINTEKKTSQRRKINMCKDTFLLTCKFLCVDDILKMITLNKYFNEYYSDIWKIIHNQLYPNSILPTKDYIILRDNIIYGEWYYKKTLFLGNYHNTSYKNIIDDEIMIKRRYDDISKSRDCRVIKTHMAEIKATKKTRDVCISDLPFEFNKIIDQFKHFTGVDPNGGVYTLLNEKIDMRLYGLDPKNSNDEQKWNDIGLKWINGEFSVNKINITHVEYYDAFDTINFDHSGRSYTNDADFIYNDFGYYRGALRGYYKKRVYPEWMC
jgi:hypothetical protein